MKNKGAKQKLKRKGAASAFGCDLTEHLESSGQDVPYVLKSCAEFIETHGIVDGIYRLSGVTSNIQKLRQEFVSDQCPDLTREVYLQDIHCVGSLCKLYFRELPNPLLTYELYKKFTEAVSRFPEDEQLARIQNVIQELPPSHYRTLEYLIKHLTHLASFSSMTNMHTRNLALVWAPNLLRSKEIEAVGCNGDAAFLEVRVQQLVIEFILNHVDQIFSNNRKASSAESIENAPVVKNLTHPSTSLPMKLVSLEEAQARSLSASHPARKERRENSLPEIVPVTGSFFHTVVDLPDSKRKLSTKSKKWKSIFNLGRSGSESKSKLSRNGSVFVRAQKLSEKATIRPAKSMDSLCSLPVEGSLSEEPVVARKPETLETVQPAAENQEMLHGQSSSTNSLQQSSEHCPTVEQAPASDIHTGPLPAVKTEQERLEMKTISPEGSYSQQEIQKAKQEEGSCVKDVTEEDPANALLEPLWPEIQHELKIIEPEEELLLFPAADPKTVPVSEPSSSVQPNNFSSGPEQCSTLSEQNSAGRTPQTTTQVPLFGATNTEQPDSHQNCQSEVAAQQSCASALPKLGTPLTGIAAPKNHHPVVEDSMSECVTPPLKWNFRSQPEANELTPGDEFSLSKGANSESEKGKDSTCQLQKESDDHTRVQTQSEMPEIVTADGRDTFSSKALNGAGIQELKEGNAVSRTHDAGDQEDEDNWADNVQSLELVEPWEDHQWVTSPLHSPTFKDIQKTIPEFQPQDQRSEAGLSLRPRFSRSLSLDSKDTVMSLWTIPFSFIDAPEQQQPCSDILPLAHELPKKSSSPTSMGKAKQDESSMCFPEEPLKTDELRYPISREETPAKQEEPSRLPLPEPERKKMDVSKENPWRSKFEPSLPYQNAPDSSLQAKITKEESSMSRDIALAEDSVTKVCSATESLQSNKDEETPRKVKTRPSSLNLDSLVPAPDFLTFESLAMPSATGSFLYGQKEVKSSDSVPSLSTTCPAGSKGISWRSPFSAHVDLDLDYLAVAHATTGRRNSAPVSVSAVRTSFMIKMCQARAVPVIPPKIQYTQIPQPLQAQNSAPQVEKKETEAKQAGRQTQRVAWGHLEPPKSPLTEKKAKAEKENSDPAQKDSVCPWHSSLGSSLESSQPSHNPSLDAPVLRRKRTSEGETGGDNPQSSKMERPSGFSKPSYRSRPGRPQSLILFSPPFPIMDHPSSSADSRVLLSPIRSPTQTSSSSSICGDLSETSRTTPEGVMLRNKMTIPKNGQRLETSTSCFYQPQRRSVILDGRSGRQIE
ncbi:rho GTPase-activating protein 31 isoform X2 [Tympanuchus pallidicinctus]|uniref:rho GTPase-activating protein 31 isoform X2 n=1 Tax=Tympanuchus pallidicinctus TaxID=109042 RepID=UPI002287159C|nr:rho GTPase-activating protein 31 isoform X2 [Tympanuchus pallidicinctus]